jgi:hypothetical protein
MQQRSLLLTFLCIIFVGVVIYGVISRGYFPVAIVNGGIITEREYEGSVAAVVNYYQSAGKTYKGLNINALLKDQDEVRRLALDQLVENTIIDRELQKRMGKDLEPIVQQKLSDIRKNQDFSKAASALYGVSFDDFINLFMRPIAERELLDGKLLLEKSDVISWLTRAKATASVTMLVPGYSWGVGEVKKN